MILIQLLFLPVTLALSLFRLVLHLFTGVVGFALGHILFLVILVGGFLLLAR